MKNIHEIEIKIEGKEWEEVLDATFQKKQKDLKMDGFRKGAVPKDVYMKKLGVESLYPDAVDVAISSAYKKVLTDSKLIPVIEPKIDIVDINETSVTFKFEITTKPEVKLGEYKNLKVKRDKAEVSKEELENEISSLKSKLAELVVKENGTVVDGNLAVIDFDGVVDGKALEGGSGTDYPLEIGSNQFIPGFEEKLIGMKTGETKNIKLQFPKDYTKDLAEKEVEFTVTIKEIKERIIPEINEDFYKDLGYENVTDDKSFEAEVKKTISDRKEASIEDKYIEDCLEKAASNMKIEISDDIVHEEIHRMIHQYDDQLKMQGLSLDQYLQFTGQSNEDLEATMKPEAVKRVTYRYMIEAVAEAEKLEISDADAKAEAQKQAEAYSTSEEEFLGMIGGLEMMKYDMKMRQAIEIIKG